MSKKAEWPTELNSNCPQCGEGLTGDTIARRENNTIRTDISGNAWCKRCTEYFDNIEHGEEDHRDA